MIQMRTTPPDALAEGSYEVLFMPCSFCKGSKWVTNEVAQAYIEEEARSSYWIVRVYLIAVGLIIFLIVVGIVLNMRS